MDVMLDVPDAKASSLAQSKELVKRLDSRYNAMVSIERELAELMSLSSKQVSSRKAKEIKPVVVQHKRYRSFTKLPKYADLALEGDKKPDGKVEASMCCICYENPANAVVMQCGHGGICSECGLGILSSNFRLCHLCRQPLSFIL